MLGFAGRAKEIHELESIIKQRSANPVNVLCITGEVGVGKTSLAYHLLQEPPLLRLFDQTYTMSAYMTPWDSLIPRIARMFFNKLPSRANIPELEKQLLTHIKDQKLFLLLDNIDNIGHKVVDFIERWSEAKHSFLIVTIRCFPPNASPPPNCKIYQLNGISEKEDWLIHNLLGDQMVKRIDQHRMWEKLKLLNGNPQKLLYLRWRAPKTRNDIASCVQDLARGATQLEAIESALHYIKLPLEHFLALGRIRVPEVDEDLLAFLWDHLDRGGSTLFVQTLQQLLDAKVLERAGRWKLRVNAHVHAQLQQAIERILGPEQRSHVEYYIGAYFRNRFSKNRNSGFPIHDLDNYVYHTVMSGNVESAHAYVFDAGLLESAYRQGLSLELEPLLLHLDRGLEEQLTPKQPHDNAKTVTDKKRARLSVMAARVKLELGRVCKDLSRHSESLKHLEEALRLLRSPVTVAVRDVAFHRLYADIEHYRGIAYSQVGRTRECITAYLDSVRYAADHQCFGPRYALSVGYLAYELKFHDIEEAQRVGLISVDLASKLRDNKVLAKNLCSLAQIQSFGGNIAKSKDNFCEAERLCRQEPMDTRELGRILVNSAVVHISSGDWEEAEVKLNEMISLIGESGDRRRRAMAEAYRGIAYYRRGRKHEGQQLVLGALRQHKEIGAQREVIYEALTWAWMEFGGKMPKLATILRHTNLPAEIHNTIEDALKRGPNIFVEFWKKHYLPTLLISDAKRID